MSRPIDTTKPVREKGTLQRVRVESVLRVHYPDGSNYIFRRDAFEASFENVPEPPTIDVAGVEASVARVPEGALKAFYVSVDGTGNRLSYKEMDALIKGLTMLRDWSPS